MPRSNALVALLRFQMYARGGKDVAARIGTTHRRAVGEVDHHAQKRAPSPPEE